MPDLSPTGRRLTALSKSWENDLPAKFLWTIDFSARTRPGDNNTGTAKPSNMTDVGDNIQKVLQMYEDNSWYIDPAMFDNRRDDKIGFFFAQSVGLPTEQVRIGTTAVDKSGGFVAGYHGGRREDYGTSNKLDITFLEQNKDIIDMFIRPWIIAVSYYGLIEDDEIDLKCNITVNLHTRGMPGSDGNFGEKENLRKSYLFENCVPYQIQADAISYGDLSESDLTRTAAFAFSNYKIIDGSDGGNYPNVAFPKAEIV